MARRSPNHKGPVSAYWAFPSGCSSAALRSYADTPGRRFIVVAASPRCAVLTLCGLARVRARLLPYLNPLNPLNPLFKSRRLVRPSYSLILGVSLL
jgi:hypothetical protein